MSRAHAPEQARPRPQASHGHGHVLPKRLGGTQLLNHGSKLQNSHPVLAGCIGSPCEAGGRGRDTIIAQRLLPPRQAQLVYPGQPQPSRRRRSLASVDTCPHNEWALKERLGVAHAVDPCVLATI